MGDHATDQLAFPCSSRVRRRAVCAVHAMQPCDTLFFPSNIFCGFLGAFQILALVLLAVRKKMLHCSAYMRHVMAVVP